MQETLIKYIADRASLSEAELQPDTLLFSAGILDSLLVLDVVAMVERAAGIKFADTEISLDNLDSVERILNFVAVKHAARSIAS